MKKNNVVSFKKEPVFVLSDNWMVDLNSIVDKNIKSKLLEDLKFDKMMSDLSKKAVVNLNKQSVGTILNFPR